MCVGVGSPQVTDFFAHRRTAANTARESVWLGHALGYRRIDKGRCRAGTLIAVRMSDVAEIVALDLRAARVNGCP